MLVMSTYFAPLSLLRLPSPSDETLVVCLTRYLAVWGTTSSLRCTLNSVTCFFLKPSLFLVPVKWGESRFDDVVVRIYIYIYILR